MRIERVGVSWWRGYETLMVADPPRTPTPPEVWRFKNAIQQRKALLYVPIPFVEFSDLAPLRHYPEERWTVAMDSLGGRDAMEGKRFADIGANVGYYTFLAAAAGASYAACVESSETATWVNAEVAKLYGVDGVVSTERGLFEEWPFEDRAIDIAFAFSSLPYIGQSDPRAMREILSRMARHVGVSFIEMGDGGSELSWCIGDTAFEILFRNAGFASVENLGSIFSSHTNTQRTLWRCDGQSG